MKNSFPSDVVEVPHGSVMRDRRRFLKTLALGVTGLAAARRADCAQRALDGRPVQAAAAGLPPHWNTMRKIDCHMHIGLSAGTRDPARIIAAADALGIEKMMTSLPITVRIAATGEVRVANDTILAAMRAYPGRFLGLAYLAPGQRDTLDELDRCLDQGMVGVKLYNQYRFSDPVVFPLVEKCIRHGLPVLGHAGRSYDARSRPDQPNRSDAGDFCELARRYPEALLVHYHLLAGHDWEWTIKQLRECPTVYLDTSGTGIEHGAIDEAVKVLGHERILFGTDAVMEGGVGKVLSANLTDAQREAVFSKNIQKILDRRKS